MIQHRHRFELQSSMNRLHTHKIAGITEPAMGFCFYHFHHYSGVSGYLDHTHDIRGKTGKPIKTENGHIHKIKCKLKSSEEHQHQLYGYTLEDIEYFQKPEQVTVPEVIM